MKAKLSKHRFFIYIFFIFLLMITSIIAKPLVITYIFSIAFQLSAMSIIYKKLITKKSIPLIVRGLVFFSIFLFSVFLEKVVVNFIIGVIESLGIFFKIVVVPLLLTFFVIVFGSRE